MTWILGIAAALCMIYYVIIVIYSGFATSFSLIWPILSLCLGLLAFGVWYYLGHKEKFPLWVPVSVATSLGTFTLIFCLIQGMIFSGILMSTNRSVDYVIVLGARLRGDQLTTSLKNRLDRAIEYAQANPNTMLILSGGQGPGESKPEALAMYEYLRFNGIPGNQMLLEMNSFSTVENLAYSRLIIEEHEKVKERMGLMELQESYGIRGVDDPVKVGILSSNFHLFRAKRIAARWGLPGAVGIAADTDPVLFLHLCVRESFAILKDQFMGNM